MTPPTLTPAEQIRRFVERHPGEWIPYARGGYVLIVNHVRASLFVDADGVLQITTSLSWQGGYAPHLGIAGREAPPLVNRIAIRVADSMQIFGGDVEALPSWLRDPVRRILRARAGELLTLAGSSPADVVSAAETLDEALCKRPVVEVTGVLRALMALGMSCRWATGADEAADDYVGLVSRRLDVVAGERDALAARMSAANAEILRLDGVVTPEIMGEVLWNLRRVLGVT
jgi:hypothetical protein